jgi:hypothetical protein
LPPWGQVAVAAKDDLKGDPRTMMGRYFDAFLYLAN